ncbi:hypothetical protein [Arcobacter roscoffensis]|uniref:Uncharacterized protein n=1 Tax=Arcobacter roscoffensis TaxID=2961520 RepID=A0ABY5DZC1_9BACT|nr:hypothetical protein [Arcobacter roscoffensis]UTJ05309.1 hypothetical protein NJU99_08510 [Arcobacter roscoffensis]
MQVNFDNNKNISYDATGREVVEEKNSTNSVFANDLDEAQKSSEQKNSKENEDKEEELTAKEKQEVTDKLLEDIMSLFKTGLTVEEMEMLRELLDAIKRKIAEAKSSNDSDEIKQIESMITRLELLVMKLQKRTKGEAVLDMEDSHVNNISKENRKDDKKSVSLDILGFEKRIEKAQKNIDDLSKTINETQVNELKKNHEELELLQALKQ